MKLADFLETLEFRRKGLFWHGDYISGRRIKTELLVTAEGAFRIRTWERGKAATRWVDILQGKKTLQVVK